MSRFAGTGVFFPVKCRQDGRYFHGVHHGREQEGDLDVDFELPHGVDEVVVFHFNEVQLQVFRGDGRQGVNRSLINHEAGELPQVGCVGFQGLFAEVFFILGMEQESFDGFFQ